MMCFLAPGKYKGFLLMLPWNIMKEIIKLWAQKCPEGHCSQSCELETTQISINSGMDEESMAYSCKEYYTALKMCRPQVHTTQVGLTNIIVSESIYSV